jgi:SAM-dependent methyltransferase
MARDLHGPAAMARTGSRVHPIATWFRGYTACVACGGRRVVQLLDVDEMESERDLRERIYRGLYPKGTPDYMLKDRAYPTQTYPARLMLCDECGTVARDPQLSPEASVLAYATDAYHPRWLESSFHEFRTAFLERMPELVEWVGPRASVLEIGSFVGAFLAAGREHGWHCQGVDVGTCVVDFARLRGLEVTKGTLGDTGFPSRSFDAVFVWSCFDQLAEPWEELREIHRVLKVGGRLLLRVPNGEFVRFLERAQRKAPSLLGESAGRILALTGLAGFPFQIGYTASSLTQILRNSGFSAIRVRNRINLRGRNLAQGARTLGRVHTLSEWLRRLTLGRLALGPWIEVTCTKDAPPAPARTRLSLVPVESI